MPQTEKMPFAQALDAWVAGASTRGAKLPALAKEALIASPSRGASQVVGAARDKYQVLYRKWPDNSLLHAGPNQLYWRPTESKTDTSQDLCLVREGSLGYVTYAGSPYSPRWEAVRASIALSEKGRQERAMIDEERAMIDEVVATFNATFGVPATSPQIYATKENEMSKIPQPEPPTETTAVTTSATTDPTLAMMLAATKGAGTMAASLAGQEAAIELGAHLLEQLGSRLAPQVPAKRTSWWPWARQRAAPAFQSAADILRTESGRRVAGAVGAAVIHYTLTHGPGAKAPGSELGAHFASQAAQANLFLLVRELAPDPAVLVNQAMTAAAAMVSAGQATQSMTALLGLAPEIPEGIEVPARTKTL